MKSYVGVALDDRLRAVSAVADRLLHRDLHAAVTNQDLDLAVFHLFHRVPRVGANHRYPHPEGVVDVAASSDPAKAFCPATD